MRTFRTPLKRVSWMRRSRQKQTVPHPACLKQKSHDSETPPMTSNGHDPRIMEPTITQNGALFAVQHRPVKRNDSQHHHRQIARPNKTISTLRTSVGEFVSRQPLGCYLELVAGNARRAL